MREDSNFDPQAVPVRPASTVMIVDDRPDLQVLMMRRHRAMVFAGGMWVFPGGAVDPGESDDFEPHCEGLDDPAASAMLGLDDGGLAYWVAAIRENFEEAGLLLARRRDGGAIPAAALAKARHSLHARNSAFLDLVLAHDLVLTTDAMHYVAHWITPPGSPRRFSARFFLTHPPEGQAVSHDDTETIDWLWVSPQEALERHARGEMRMMTPTTRMLRCLTLFDSADAVMAASAQGLAEEQVRVAYLPDGGYEVVLPGEPGYASGDGAREFGWVRLRPPGTGPA